MQWESGWGLPSDRPVAALTTCCYYAPLWQHDYGTTACDVMQPASGATRHLQRPQRGGTCLPSCAASSNRECHRPHQRRPLRHQLTNSLPGPHPPLWRHIMTLQGLQRRVLVVTNKSRYPLAFHWGLGALAPPPGAEPPLHSPERLGDAPLQVGQACGQGGGHAVPKLESIVPCMYVAQTRVRWERAARHPRLDVVPCAGCMHATCTNTIAVFVGRSMRVVVA